jgi:hypothetical protein
MPIAETPFAQLVVAVATNCTEVATVLLLPGAVTDTPAKADVAKVATRHRRCRGYFFFMY